MICPLSPAKWPDEWPRIDHADAKCPASAISPVKRGRLTSIDPLRTDEETPECG